MFTLASWLALVLALVSLVYGLVLTFGAPPPAADRVRRRLWWGVGVVALVGGVIAGVVAAPAAAPFAAGWLLGWGLAAGVLVGLVAMMLAVRLPTDSLAGPVTVWSLAAAGLAVLLLAGWGYPQPLLLGYALGLAGVGLVTGLAASRLELPATAWAVESGALFGATAAAALTLITLHFDTPAGRAWWSAGLLAAALAPACWAVTAATQLRGGGALLAGALYLAGLALVCGFLLHAWLPLLLSVGGLVAYWVVSWLLAAGLPGAWRGLLGGLVVVSLVVVAFRLLAGAGEGFALLAGWVAVAGDLSRGREGARAPLLGALTIGLAAMAYRLLMEAGGGAEVVATVHYGYVGLILGALLPPALVDLAADPTARGRFRAIWPAVLAGVVAILTPPALLATWGTAAALGMQAGLVAALAVGMAGLVGRAVPVVAAAMALVTVGVWPFLGAFEGLTRLQRGWVLGIVCLLVIVLAAAAAAARRPAEARP